MIEIILILSVLLNIVLGWYIYKLLMNLLTIETDFEDLRTKLIDFATHLRGINRVESFYGDPMITALVKHMQRLAEDIESYAQVMIFFEDDIKEDTDDNTKEEAKAQN